MYGNETTISLTRGDKYDGDCPKVTCAQRQLKPSKGDDRVGALALSLGSSITGVPNLAALGVYLENGISLEEVSRILFSKF
jgi:hypothetical protein